MNGEVEKFSIRKVISGSNLRHPAISGRKGGKEYVEASRILTES